MKTYLKRSYLIGALLLTVYSSNTLIASDSDDLNDDIIAQPKEQLIFIRIFIEENGDLKFYLKKDKTTYGDLEFYLKKDRTVLDLKKKIAKLTGIAPWLQTIKEEDPWPRRVDGKPMTMEIADYQILDHFKHSDVHRPRANVLGRGYLGPDYLSFSLQKTEIVDPVSQKTRPIQSKEDELLAIDQEVQTYRKDLSELERQKEKVQSGIAFMQQNRDAIEQEISKVAGTQVPSTIETPVSQPPEIDTAAVINQEYPTFSPPSYDEAMKAPPVK